MGGDVKNVVMMSPNVTPEKQVAQLRRRRRHPNQELRLHLHHHPFTQRQRPPPIDHPSSSTAYFCIDNKRRLICSPLGTHSQSAFFNGRAMEKRQDRARTNARSLRPSEFYEVWYGPQTRKCLSWKKVRSPCFSGLTTLGGIEKRWPRKVGPTKSGCQIQGMGNTVPPQRQAY